MTDWQLTGGAFIAAILALLSASAMYIELMKKKHISAGVLLGGGIFYGIFLISVFEGIIRQL
jgi:cation:H+ antiporter